MSIQKKLSYRVLLYYFYPFLMIGVYFIGWKTLFYICVVPLIILTIFLYFIQIKYDYWKFAILPFLTLIIVSEIGYLLTGNIIDGILMGINLLVIVGGIENLIQYYINKDNIENPG